MSELPEQAIGGRWRPLRRLGAGATGDVLLVQDLARGGPPLALKRVAASHSAVLHDEFRRLQSLRGPGLPRVDELAIDPRSGDVLFTAEPGRGVPFLTALRGASLPIQLEAVADVLRTLALLGERGVVHRDLKPEHLLVDLGVDPPRVVLIDLGLAVESHATAELSGSLPYLAPELFRGAAPSPSSDLYALGVILHELWGDGLPFCATTPGEWAKAHLEAPVRFGAGFTAPASLRELVARLLAKQPAERYADAAECLADLSRAAAEPLPVATAATLQGRIRSVPLLDPAWRESVAPGDPRPGGPATWVTAPTRAGRDALMRELRITALQGEAWPLVACFDPASGSAPQRESLGFQLAALCGAPNEPVDVDALFERLRRGDLPRRVVLFLEEVPRCHGDDEPLLRFLLRAQVEVVASGAGVAAADPRVAVGWEPSLELRSVHPRALSAAELARRMPDWIGMPLTPQLARVIGAGGKSEIDVARVVDLLCCAVDAGALVQDGRQVRLDPDRFDLAAATGDLLDVTRERLRRLSPARVRILGALALLEWPVERDLLRAVLPALADEDLDGVVASGLVEFSGGRYSLTEGDLAALALQEVGRDASAFHSAAARFLAGHPERDDQPFRRARHAFRASAGREAAVEYARAALSRVDAQRLAEAESAANEVLEGASEPAALATASLALGIVRLRRSSHAEARELLAPLADRLRGSEPALAGRARVEHARALERCGGAEEALARLEPVAPEGDPPGAAALRAYVLHQLRRDTEAEAVCRQALREPGVAGDGGELRLRMIHAVALWRIGKFDEARQAFDQARDAARIAKAPLQAAVVDSNRARFEEDLGRLELAARIAVGAVATSVAFGDRQQEAMQLVNLANLWFDLGRFSECKSAIQRSREIAHAMRQPGLLRRLDLIQAHVALNEGDFAAAHAALDRSVNQARELSDEPSVWRAELVRTEVLMRQGRGRAARRLLDQAAAALDGAGHSDEKALAAEYRLQWATFAGSPALVARLAAAVELPPGSRRRRAFLRDAQLSALHRLARKADLARIAREQIADLEGAELVALSARAHAALALAERGAAGSDERIAAARQAYARVKAPGHLALKAEAALMLGRAARDVRLLEEAEEFARRAGHLPLAKRARELRRRVAPARAGDVDGATRLASLERLMRVAKRITAAPDGEELLRLLLDDAVEATRAARGFLILARGGELAVRCARNLDAADIERPELSFSSTVARSVAADGKSVLFADVSTDERWRDAASISQLKLLSVLCAPIGGQGRIIGSVYLDEPTRIDAFRPGDLRYVESLADFAAIALEKIELLDQDRAQKRQLLDSQQEIARLNTRLQQALLAQREELHSVRASLERARAATGDAPQFAGIVSHGAAMDEVRRRIERVARSTLPVLVTGESGTGKELVARAIHGAGTRAARPFEAFNCSTTPNGLIENELFGHRKGAFTGADVDQPGLFEHCDGGTLFLDEVAEAPAELQAKLLRVVQDGIVQRLGGGAAVHVDVRLIAATNRDLKAQVAAGRFREDLLYRLNVLPINLLPLRERREDIPLLLEHFARREAAKLGIPPPRFTPVAWRCLMRHDWPGNVRELEHAIQRLFVLHRDVEEIGVEALRSELPAAVADEPLQTADLRGYLDRQEEQFITEVLARCGGNRSKAAKELGISERNLYQRLQRFRGADHPKP